MFITVKIKSNYGIETVYPHCKVSETFARIAGTRTLTTHALRDIQSLGYQVEVYREEPRILRAIKSI
jgi:hypothetical protein